MSGATYESAGVSIEAGDKAVELMRVWVDKARRPEMIGGIGGFAGLFDASALKAYDRPLLASSADGVGTKVAIAQALDKHDTIGFDLVGMLVDDLVVCGAEPLFLTDYIATGHVVLVGLEEPGVLGGLAADQRAARGDAGLGDALDDGGDALGYDAPGRDVVGHEQRLGAADDQVVDDHAHQVEPDRVVHAHGLRDRDLGADPVGRGRQQRATVRRQCGGVEQAGEATDAADDLGATGLFNPLRHQLDRAVTGFD